MTIDHITLEEVPEPRRAAVRVTAVAREPAIIQVMAWLALPIAVFAATIIAAGLFG
jgi:hypothetical protein